MRGSSVCTTAVIMQMQEFCPWFKHEARQMAVKTKSVFVSGDTVMTLRLSPGFGSGPGGVQRRAREVDQEMYAAMGRYVHKQLAWLKI